MSRLPSIGVTVCKMCNGLNSFRGPSLIGLCVVPLVTGLTALLSAVSRVRQQRCWLTTLLFIKAAIITDALLKGVCGIFASARKPLCFTLFVLGPALEFGTGRQVNVELSY